MNNIIKLRNCQKKETKIFARMLCKAITNEFGENFTEGFFEMTKIEYCKEIKKLFLNYMKNTKDCLSI